MTNRPPHMSYRRNRFSTRLPQHFLYTASHAWLHEFQPGHLRIGLTKFATRMLGELVETGVEVKPGDAVAVGDVIGWIECLKAASDLYCTAQGEFVGQNPALAQDPELLNKDPYGKGWLYEVKGSPEPNAVDASGYAAILDAAIDKMLGVTPS